MPSIQGELGSRVAADAIRRLDYLSARGDGQKPVGVTGCSGEGTLAPRVTALDPRKTMATPDCYDCYVTSRSSDLENELSTDAGQNPLRLLAYGLDGDGSASDLCITPYLDSGGRELLFRPAWRSPQQVFADPSRIHRLLGSLDSAALSVGAMAHGFHKHASEAMYRSWIKHAGLHAEWQEPTMEEIPEVQFSATLGGQRKEVVEFGSKEIFVFTQARVRAMKAQRSGFDRHALVAAVRQQRKSDYRATPLLRRRIRCTASIRLHPYLSGFPMPDCMPDPERDRNRDPAYSNSDWSLDDRQIRAGLPPVYCSVLYASPQRTVDDVRQWGEWSTACQS